MPQRTSSGLREVKDLATYRLSEAVIPMLRRLWTSGLELAAKDVVLVLRNRMESVLVRSEFLRANDDIEADLFRSALLTRKRCSRSLKEVASSM
jgi:hypothetical protein